MPRTMHHDKINGTVAGLRDCGNLVLLFLDAEDGRVIPVPMVYQAFRHLVEDRACGPGDLIGRSVSIDGDLLTFLD